MEKIINIVFYISAVLYLSAFIFDPFTGQKPNYIYLIVGMIILLLIKTFSLEHQLEEISKN